MIGDQLYILIREQDSLTAIASNSELLKGLWLVEETLLGLEECNLDCLLLTHKCMQQVHVRDYG